MEEEQVGGQTVRIEEEPEQMNSKYHPGGTGLTDESGNIYPLNPERGDFIGRDLEAFHQRGADKIGVGS
jgi:hypothetical protein